MANLKEVRNRITSVTSTQQITAAMKMVSAAKFRKAQQAILGMRPYAAMVNDIIANIRADDVVTPYHEVRKRNKVLLIVISSNKGLCGAFNSSVMKLANSRIAYWQQQGCQQLSLCTMGKKAYEFFSRQEQPIVAHYEDLLDHPQFDAVYALSERIMTQFRNKEYDYVEVVYNKFKNSLVQELTTEQFLPVVPNSLSADNQQLVGSLDDYIFEPSKGEILQQLVPFMLHTLFYRIILDSLASEHGARMTAMQTATDNATQLLNDLKLTYNKVRQASITNEIIEIVSGSEALKG